MAYFNELPDVEVVSRFLNTENNEEYIKIKNLWRRAKLREDIADAVTAFNYYQVQDNERPDQIAQKIYENPELDWVILITNNITNFNEDWPLDNNSLYNYLIDKYGSEEALQEIHHTETVEQRDNFNRIVVPENLFVDDAGFGAIGFTTSSLETQLPSFPAQENLKEISVNLIQALRVNQIVEGDVLYPITDIRDEISFLKIYTRNSGVLDIQINNNLLDNWPTGWGGTLQVFGRDENKLIPIEDILNTELGITTRINISNKLYEITGELVNGELVPIFKFRYLP